MKKDLLEAALHLCVAIGCLILKSFIDGGMTEGNSNNHYTRSRSSHSGPNPRIYRPTGRSRGYGPRTYNGTKSY